ncbi:uncharacterized protein N7506_003236 [Penicillium brevicompactum]|uniref:uncharacterized protein n=1 Tax=Penicillium brevicompactum TaxID=5074 RepID=UPI00253F84E0|nr:uncharacterized protein N7506_003236 [Penicillium brevicompactum]KAJ5343412.1 hypothetical protein N7506_003236 [Penicillium brevicompactum]
MAAVKSVSSMSPRKSKRQKKCRRKATLMKKASEYSKMCDADVCVGIRLRETGQVHILTADDSGFWAFLASQLCAYYPKPNFITVQDLDRVNKGLAVTFK